MSEKSLLLADQYRYYRDTIRVTITATTSVFLGFTVVAVSLHQQGNPIISGPFYEDWPTTLMVTTLIAAIWVLYIYVVRGAERKMQQILDFLLERGEIDRAEAALLTQSGTLLTRYGVIAVSAIIYLLILLDV